MSVGETLERIAAALERAAVALERIADSAADEHTGSDVWADIKTPKPKPRKEDLLGVVVRRWPDGGVSIDRDSSFS